MEGNHFDLSPCEFRDAMALRYGRIPVDLPTHCDADGEISQLIMLLTVQKGAWCMVGTMNYET